MQAAEILIAVSNLSPVKSQKLIPHSFKYWIVSGAWSWSLSSTAVNPKNVNSFSNLS